MTEKTKRRKQHKTLQDFTETIISGRRAIAWEIVEEIMSRGLTFEQIQHEFVLPTLQAVSALESEPEALKARTTLNFVIERLRNNAPRERSLTPVVLLAGCGGDAIEETAARIICEMLGANGWSAEYVGIESNPDEIVGRAAATRAEVIMLLGLGETPTERAAEILEGLAISEINCRALLCGKGFAEHADEYGDDEIIVLPDIRAAFLLLSAAGQRAAEEGENEREAHEYLEESLEASNVLFCTLSPDDLTILSANQRCRDDFGMCQGEKITDYLEPDSANILKAMLINNSLPGETVEIALMKRGEAYLVDALVLPAGRTKALLALPRQEEIDKLTTILTNYNKEINSLNCKLHKADSTIEAQKQTIEAAHRELSQAYETLRALEWSDPLTGAFNKHYYELVLVKEVNRTKRYGRHLSFLMIDIDDFTDINKNMGHPAGDAVLRHVAKIITQHTRADIDWLARIGADEFVLVMPETDMEGCMTVGEKLLSQIAETPFAFDNCMVHITASAGGATYDPTQTIHLSYKQLPKAAGAALSSAQKRGPNSVKISKLG